MAGNFGRSGQKASYLRVLTPAGIAVLSGEVSTKKGLRKSAKFVHGVGK